MTAPRRFPRRQGLALRPTAGFTLVEVLVALTIVALCLAAGLRAAGAMTSNADRLAVNSLAQWCAENELTEMRLTKAFPGVGDNSFSCTQLGRDFSGKMAVRSTPNPNFRRVEAQVFDDQNRPLLTITTIVGRY
ncbi:type II secretion system minor pseudopilin GspI [Mitsuaria sp. GD03876]|uniref:type II secretion system minor pseudopilin GspI n=1 Tax=Mitsuaria sp. GD03876 TaxID=2975399 RepID=UPI0024475A09|nr:type II secretion system minor pseudopilin GspI [Mitsuaria sp. GD03876]MDH0864184.1 type II secretion system minor pseudopilin GspI [Mitsuaria sp. GD03876]